MTFLLWFLLLCSPVVAFAQSIDPLAINSQDAVPETRPDINRLQAELLSPNHFEFGYQALSERTFWRNYRVSAITAEPADNWETNAVDAEWSPSFRHLTPQLFGNLHQNRWPGCETNARQIGAGIDYYNRQASYRVERINFVTSLEDISQTIDSLDDDLGLARLDARTDIRLSTRLRWRFHGNAQADETGAETSLEYQLGAVSSLGVWFGANGNHTVPSIVARTLYEPTYNLRVRLELKPGIDCPAWSSQYTRMPYAWLEDAPAPTLVPIDAVFSTEYQGLLAFGLSWRYRYLYDDLTYRSSDRELPIVETIDVQRHDLNMTLGYRYGLLTVENRAVGTVCRDENDDVLPFIPEFENMTRIAITKASWSVELNTDRLSGRRNELDMAMENVTLLGITATYQITPSFRVALLARNLLDHDYRAYSLAPLERASFGIDLHWSE